MSNVIVTENLNTGTTVWQITQASATQIHAYCDKTSYNPGDTVTFFVSTQVGGTTYTITIYRLGWYGGTGGCLKHTSATQTGVAQGYWNGSTLTNCPSAIIDNTTHNLEAGWASSYTWAVPANACTGAYLAKFTDANGYQSYATFVVKGNSTADYVYIHPVTTDVAYNDWGGYSLYTNPTVGVKVSFNRPHVNGNGAAGLLQYELQALKWLEQQGYNLSYLTSVDLHANASQIMSYGAMLSTGHDEYWSKEMRDGVEAALAAGVGLAFFGANACYWQCRFAPDASSNANRALLCYKVDPLTQNLANDPLFGVDNTRLTERWRDSPVSRPENRMIGIMYSSYLNSIANNVAWKVDAAASSPFLTGTGLVNNTSYGSDLVGYEYDKQFASPTGPSNLQILGTTPVTDHNSVADTSHTTTYIAASGAMVFATGSICWTWALDTYRYNAANVAVVPGMQSLMCNIMQNLIRPKNLTGFSRFAAYHT